MARKVALGTIANSRKRKSDAGAWPIPPAWPIRKARRGGFRGLSPIPNIPSDIDFRCYGVPQIGP